MNKHVVSRKWIRIGVLGAAACVMSTVSIFMWYGVYEIVMRPAPDHAHWALPALFGVVFIGGALLCCYGVLHELADMAGRRRASTSERR